MAGPPAQTDFLRNENWRMSGPHNKLDFTQSI
jgi:hypothetical protein